MMISLFDTHTHFDVEDFDVDRQFLAEQAGQHGVRALVLIGFLASRFADLQRTATQMRLWQQKNPHVPTAYLAPGLHPLYIEQHTPQDILKLDDFLTQHRCVAIGEIGLDYFPKTHKTPEMKQKQAEFFDLQLELAKQHDLPVLLHIRRGHGDVLQQLKRHRFRLGGIAHAFSGGAEEAKAFARLGFKIGITGLITNPNAKKLQQVLQNTTADDWVIETDCPDMTPVCCQKSTEYRTRNTPANVRYVFEALLTWTHLKPEQLAEQLWNNSVRCLKIDDVVMGRETMEMSSFLMQK